MVVCTHWKCPHSKYASIKVHFKPLAVLHAFPHSGAGRKHTLDISGRGSSLDVGASLNAGASSLETEGRISSLEIEGSLEGSSESLPSLTGWDA